MAMKDLVLATLKQQVEEVTRLARSSAPADRAPHSQYVPVGWVAERELQETAQHRLSTLPAPQQEDEEFAAYRSKLTSLEVSLREEMEASKKQGKPAKKVSERITKLEAQIQSQKEAWERKRGKELSGKRSVNLKETAKMNHVDGRSLLLIRDIPTISKTFGFEAFGDCVYMLTALKALKYDHGYVPPRRNAHGPDSQPYMWTVEQVLEWLGREGLAALRKPFADHRIDGDVLFRMDIAEFVKFDERIAEFEERLVDAISALRPLDYTSLKGDV
eukprot:m.165433 g.165433  ORF g.165433 m.165433 type:complete len:274 (-) comp53119_c0_seq6:78-899(-)